MTAKNFTAAVNDLAEPIRRRFDLPDVYQLALVVPDAVAADEAMVRDWGLDPSFIIDGEAACGLRTGRNCTSRADSGSPTTRAMSWN